MSRSPAIPCPSLNGPALVGPALIAIACLVLASAAQARQSLSQFNSRLTVVEDTVDIIAEVISLPEVTHIELVTRPREDGSHCSSVIFRPFHRLNLDGTVAEQAFVIPLNTRLRIFDVRWDSHSNDEEGFSIGSTVMMRVGAPAVIANDLFLPYASAPITILVPNQLSVGASENLTVGFHVNAGRALCGWAQVGGSASDNAGTGDIEATLRGLLVPIEDN